MTHAENVLARTPGVLAVAGDLTHPDERTIDSKRLADRIRSSADLLDRLSAYASNA